MPLLPLLALAGLAVFLACTIPAGRSRITRWQVPAVMIAATGSIGLLAMVARVLYRESAAGAATA